MANGNGASKGWMLDLASRVGPIFGGIMGVFYALAYILLFIKDHDLSDLAQVCFGLGFATAAVGLGHAVKKATDINVSAQAERIVNSPGPDTSTVPQIQNEIDKINAGRPTRP